MNFKINDSQNNSDGGHYKVNDECKDIYLR